jgi:polar amino acid transport system permease protein
VTASIVAQWDEYLPTLLDGLGQSARLWAAACIVGLPAGLALAIARSASVRAMRWPAAVVVELGRSLPVLLVLQLAFYGLPSLGVILSSFVASTVALGWITAAFASEILRGSIGSVPYGQREAAGALALPEFHTYRTIILPQAVRVALPGLLGLGINIFQGTALAFSVGYPELMGNAYQVGNEDFRYLSVFVLAGLLYTAIVVPASLLVRRVELRLGQHVSSELR